MLFEKLKGWRRCAFAGLVLVLLYGVHFWNCAQSPLVQFSFVNQHTDMYANLRWAQSIQQQGWLNPHPYHPDNDWMKPIASREQWLQWWGGDVIFQQSPLYAYFLSGLLWLNGNVLYVHFVQALLGMGLCVLTGWIAFRATQDSRAGWVAFWLAALYSPYYAYSWPLLRDLLGWIITGVVLLLLLELDLPAKNERKKNLMMGAVGLALGIGYLARETFLLIIPLVVVVLAIQAIRFRNYVPFVCLMGGVLLAMSPLLIRNAEVGAPFFSSSNRFAEGFIEGNARSTLPDQFVIPTEMPSILEKTGGKPLPVVVATLKTHPNVWSFLHLQTLKVLSLLDPYEPCDNLSIYFMENISPPVRWGLRHWMIIIPGVGGLILSLLAKDRRHFWLWLLLVPLLAGVMIGTPLSRYRQSLVILWIPWAAYFLVTWWKSLNENRHQAWTMAFIVFLGWISCVTVFARFPRNLYERPWEYSYSVTVYQNMGQPDKAEEMRQLLNKKFPRPGP
jgi:hypothetical protein